MLFEKGDDHTAYSVVQDYLEWEGVMGGRRGQIGLKNGHTPHISYCTGDEMASVMAFFMYLWALLPLLTSGQSKEHSLCYIQNIICVVYRWLHLVPISITILLKLGHNQQRRIETKLTAYPPSMIDRHVLLKHTCMSTCQHAHTCILIVNRCMHFNCKLGAHPAPNWGIKQIISGISFIHSQTTKVWDFPLK